jgi:muramidase (phage lysozyme)
MLYLAAIAAALLLAFNQPASAQSQDPSDPPDDNTDQLTSSIEDIQVTMTPSTYTPAAVPVDIGAQNEKAFLDMLAFSEGVAPGDDGYRTLFGGALMDSLDDHPRRFFSFTNKRGEVLKTSAAGRYQFLMRTWDTLARRLSLPDFGPASQDAAALELVRERGAAQDVQAGRITQAIAKCAPIWASLPGAGYAQHENKLTALVAQFSAVGGNLEA